MHDFIEGLPAKKLTPSELFRAWADRIDKNAPEDFSGAFLIIPPSGEPICGLLIDQAPDINTFYALAQNKISAAIDVLNDQQLRAKRGGF